MPNTPPNTDQILAGVRRTLNDDILPVIGGYERFRLRVAIAMLDLVDRDTASRKDRDAAERSGLQHLLESDQDDLDLLNRALKDALRSGRLRWDHPDLLAHVKKTVAADLAVDNPRWFRQGDAPPHT